MPSSSVNPENGVAAAAELLASYAAMPTRATDAESFVSFPRTQDEVDALCKMYGVPKEFTARPAGDLRANSTPPPGSICVYARALEAGMRVPLHGFFRDALAHLGVAPAQLTPNAWRFMAGFHALCHSASVPPSLAVFLRFFTLYAFDSKHKKGWYFFRCRRDNSSLRFRGLPKSDSNSIKDWKHEFFFLSSPEPWPCAVEWGEPSKRSYRDLRLTVEENKSVVKLLSAHGGAAVDLRNLLPAGCSGERCRLCNSYPAVSAAVITTASPPPPLPSSTRMDPSVHDMMKTMLKEKAAAQASALAKKRTWEEADGGQSPPLSLLSSVHSPPPQHFPSRHDGHTELLQGAVAQQLAREREAAALREQLEEAKNELAAAKRAADAEREKAKSEFAAAGAELENTKAELTAVEGEVVKTKAELSASLAEAELAAAKQAAEAVKTKEELAAARAEVVKTKTELAAARAETVNTKVELAAAREEVVKTKAELAAAKRSNAVLTAAETELVKVKAKLAAAEARLESAKAAAVQQLLASEENVRQRAEDALEGYRRWRGRHAPAGRAA
ncbi:uncharacterized protein [Triticum aestivum]|uniref:uncharacterized protein n=1 Tax=Triticum aestivum TaxID=4565 RepID=UPI001D0352C2|nr:uncharacterized protein LOC123163149 [Triticum aestivum]